MSKFFTGYDRPPNIYARNSKPSLALQQFRDECDVNNLVARYNRTGTFYNALDCAGRLARMPQYGDFSELGDFREQQQKILDVYETFATLPAKIRERFNNNPAFFVEFVGDEKNLDECVKLGVFERPALQPKELPAAEPVKTGDGVAVENPISQGNPGEIKK